MVSNRSTSTQCARRINDVRFARQDRVGGGTEGDVGVEGVQVGGADRIAAPLIEKRQDRLGDAAGLTYARWRLGRGPATADCRVLAGRGNVV